MSIWLIVELKWYLDVMERKDWLDKDYGPRHKQVVRASMQARQISDGSVIATSLQ